MSPDTRHRADVRAERTQQRRSRHEFHDGCSSTRTPAQQMTTLRWRPDIDRSARFVAPPAHHCEFRSPQGRRVDVAHAPMTTSPDRDPPYESRTPRRVNERSRQPPAPCADCRDADHRSEKVQNGPPRDHSGQVQHATRQPDRRERMVMIIERDGPTCVWCRRAFDDRLVRPTTEHLVPRIKGGPSWLENEVAACRRCNNERGHRTLGEYADECEGLGRDPDVDRIVRALHSLQAAIGERGGQRRARPYIATQLRRLQRRPSIT